MDVFRSLRFRLPAFFLAGSVLAGLISTLIALGLFQDYTEDRLVAELQREARGLSSLYAEQAIRIELWGDEVERISKINPLTGDTICQLEQCAIYPAKHFVTQRSKIERAVLAIRAELAERLTELKTVVLNLG